MSQEISIDISSLSLKNKEELMKCLEELGMKIKVSYYIAREGLKEAIRVECTDTRAYFRVTVGNHTKPLRLTNEDFS